MRTSLLTHAFRVLSPDDKGGGGGSEETEEQKAARLAEEKKKADEKAKADAEANKGGNGDGADKSGKQFTQADMDALAGKIRDEERQKAQKLAEQEDLKRKGEFEKLAETRRVELETATKKIEALQAVVDFANKFVDDAIKEWDKDVMVSDPGKDDVQARLAWFERTKPLAERLKKTAPNLENGKGGGKGSEGTDPLASQFDRKKYAIPGQSSQE